MWLAAHLLVAQTRSGGSAPRSEFYGLLRATIDTVKLWRRRAREREDLRRYLHYELKNAPSGLCKDAWSEAKKPFWQV